MRCPVLKFEKENDQESYESSSDAACSNETQGSLNVGVLFNQAEGYDDGGQDYWQD
jgi:hypothetical protein